MPQNLKPKKIAMLLYYYHPYVSGLSINAKRLAEELVKKGHQVTVYTSLFKSDLQRNETINGVKVVRMKPLFKLGKGMFMPQFIYKMPRLAREYELINFHLPLSESGFASLFVPKHKLLTTYVCDINLGKGLLNKFIQAVSFFSMGIILRRSKVITTLNDDYFAHCRFKQFLEKSQQVYPPTSVEEFQKREFSSLQEKLKLKAETYKIGFVGRIVYEKGIEYLLDAVKYLQAELNDFKIIIVGDYQNIAGGSIKTELDKYLELYPDKIMFTGFLSDDELKQFYSMIDVFAFPSIDPLEAYGIVQVEAMSAGTPVVASDLPGVRVPVQVSGFGLLAQAKNSKDLAEKILELHRSKPKLDKAKLAELNITKSLEQYLEAMRRMVL